MAGFSNDVIFGTNIDLRGVKPIVGQFTTDGQLLIGSTAAPNARIGTLSAGPGISITPGAGTIQISTISVGFTWNVVTNATNPNSLVAENGYIAKGAASVSFLLPATSAIGDRFIIVGYGNLWTLAQNAGQQIFLGIATTTLGVGGSLTATNAKDILELVCVTANTEFSVINVIGNLTVV